MADFSFFLPLPKKTKTLVKKGDRINKGQKVATFNRFKKHKINLAKKLGTSAKKTSSCLLVNLGEKISKDKIIAETKTLFKKISVPSPVAGQVFAFDNDTGLLTIEIAQEARDLLSPFSGKVEKVTKEGVTIKIKAEKILDFKKSWGNNIFGQLVFHDGALTALGGQYQKKVILTNRLFPALINKAQAIGSLAIVGPDKVELNEASLDDLTIAQLEPKQIRELKNFIDHWVIIDIQQKKLAILEE
jgi:glycine cleavage system H lipoate-binding protein